MRRRSVAEGVAAVLIMTAASGAVGQTAAAQPPPERWNAPEEEPSVEEVARARELFVQGTREVAEQSWQQALVHFEQSYALSGVAAALYNVAAALKELGRFVEAKRAFEQLLAEHSNLAPAMSRQAQAMLDEVSAQLSSLQVQGLPDADALQLRLDGALRPVPPQRPAEFQLDPGPHSLSVELPLHEPFEWQGFLDPGEREVIEVELTSAAAESGEPSTAEAESSWFENLWLWVGVGVVAAAGTGLTVWALSQDQKLEPQGEFVVQL